MGESSASVGIFWSVPGPGTTTVLCADRTALLDAELYGDCLTHPRSHFELWETWKADASRRPPEPLQTVWQTEYDDHPRGRVVFSTAERVFWVFLDRRLATPTVQDTIVAMFGLPPDGTIFRLDAHYRPNEPR